MKRPFPLFAALIASLVYSASVAMPASARLQDETQDSVPFDREVVASTIDGIIKTLNEAYVFPEVAEKMDKAIREHAEVGRYDDVTSASTLANMLTDDLRAVCQHIPSDGSSRRAFVGARSPGSP